MSILFDPSTLCPACRAVWDRKMIITAKDVCARCWEVINA